ncbi:Transketolase [bioreactor metagenome]|jgi:transketolase|uniref:Transketolase n=1 Tax=bioreactor metagenome TaxID=1076179 RepID=A0A644W4P2_9ZZZZ|nr:transketolase [Bacteroidales bacterium]WRQ32190.1 transketolase [Bacteroidales bacterium MB20-C3-3]MBP6453828.1 transketolase [Bacteroidales bacterium]MBP8678150.1 transketolase [Bacteroidales bacterium]MBP9584476.1 transketolase [Bacteroidales bacterium]
MTQNYPLGEVASQVRRDIVRMVNLAASGHPGGSLSSTDILTALFFSEMNHDPANWRRDGKGRDMFFLSAGHLSPVFYSVLARSGYFSVSELATFRKMGSRLQGHPSVERGLPGVHVASGSLGQGLSVACGAAIAKKLEGEKCVVFALLGDGEQQEGQIWEAAMFASHQKLGNLIAITDWNGQQIDGPNDKVISLGDLKAKWDAFGWDVVVADGHDLEAIKAVLKSARESVSDERPKMLLMKTDMGKGVDFMQGTHQWHGKAPNADQTEKALSQLKETIGDF